MATADICRHYDNAVLLWTNIHTHTHPFNGLLSRTTWAGTRKVKPICIFLKQETESGSGISWAICKSASRSRQITTPAPTGTTQFLQAGCPSCCPTNRVKALKDESCLEWTTTAAQTDLDSLLEGSAIGRGQFLNLIVQPVDLVLVVGWQGRQQRRTELGLQRLLRRFHRLQARLKTCQTTLLKIDAKQQLGVCPQPISRI